MQMVLGLIGNLGWPELVILLVLFGVPVLLVIGVVAVFMVKKKSRQKEATCGGCGYIVEGISSLLCPECGGDLRKVGIVKGRE
ncbi:hypothetical protein [Poriferisphaera sp. WC338]|uniref:hypothetical protein n=1 Tax=Poriferisphaera sp. WC338 TaxID=3425129 RepID=UPI003D8184EC